MEILEAFKHFLFTSKNNPTKVTVKNYVADIRKFIAWYGNYYQRNFIPGDVNRLIIEAYTKSLLSDATGTGENTSAFKSYKRYLASLKRFSAFLQAEGIITANPFPQEKKPDIIADPWFIRGYKNGLSSDNLSHHSIKNYLNDLNQFIHWYKTVKGLADIKTGENIFAGINSSTIEEYKQRLVLEANYSPVSVNRKLSSLRKYLYWLKENKIINQSISLGNISPSKQPQAPLADDPVLLTSTEELRQFAGYNQTNNTPQTKAKSRFGPIRFVSTLGALVNNSFDFLLINPLATLASSGNYNLWKLKGKIVFQPVKKMFHTKTASEIVTGLSSAKQDSPFSRGSANTDKQFTRWEAFVLNRKINTVKAPHNIAKSFYAPLAISLTNLPWYKKLLHHIRYNRPNWYRKYHAYPIVHYIHFALVLVAAIIVGVKMYQVLFNDSLRQNPVLAEMTAAPPRTLAFQGRLTDPLNSPITAETPLRFGIYNDAIATGSAMVWQEVQDVNPDQNGFFSVTLGRRNPMSQKVFSDNPNLYIGITIGANNELEPRQQLATTNYAANAAALQGLKPITQVNAGTNNVILALDSTGNLTIGGSAHPTFEASGGEFTLSGQTVTLTTNPDSNTNIQINPDGTGIIDLQKPLQNTTNYSNIPGVQGAVEVDDSLAVLASSSAQSAFIINQNGIGALISASTSGLAKFTVDNLGAGMFAGNLAINGNNLTTNATSFNLLNSTINLNIGNNASAITLGADSGTTTINNSLVVSKLATFSGGVLIPAGQTLSFNGSISSGLIPSIDSFYDLGSSTNHWNNGYLKNLIVGGTATQSATPVATFNANTTDTALTINNDGSGNLLSVAANNVNKFIISQAGNIGIGNPLPAFKLDLQDSQAATAAAQIYNTDTGNNADGLIIKLGNNSSTAVSSSNHFVSFETDGVGVVGSIQGNGSKGISFVQNGLADFAEYFKKDAKQDIAYGSLVCVSQDGKVLPCDTANANIVGVTSEHPAFLGGENLGTGSVAVGLTGLVKTNVTTQNGNIKPGDLITISSIPGIGVKALEPGLIVGRAIEAYASTDKNIVGSVLVSIHITWFDPQNQLTDTGNIQNTLALNPGDVTTKPLNLNSQNISIDGKPLQQYIADSVANNNTMRTDTITPTSTGSNIGLKLSNNELSILNYQLATSSAVARFDNQGNADLNGKLTTNNLETNDATISGTLHAKNIIADSIEGLDQKLATLAASISQQYDKNRTNNIYNDSNASLDNKNINNATSSSELIATQSAIASSSADLSTNQPIPPIYNSTNPFSMNSSLLNTFADMASMSGQLATVANLKTDVAMVNNNLMVYGSSSLADVSVTGQLTIGGSFILTQNSMDTIGSDLQLQSLRQGNLSIMAGLVKIDTDGNLSVSGNATFAKDVTVKGTLSAKTIVPVANSDLTIQLANNNSDKKAESVIHDSKFLIQNSSGSGVMSINQLGDLIASGTGAFSQLAAQGLHIIRGVQADTSTTDTVANGSAGKAIITAQQTHRTVVTPYVTANSLIYITATSNTEGVTPYISRQTPEDKSTNRLGSFTIEIPSTIDKNITLNWWIVN